MAPFTIDLSRYRLVDLSMKVTPPGKEGRPFKIERGLLADDCYKHDIQTHTHVGCHIESPYHFDLDWPDVSTYPLEKFCGRAVLFEISAIEPVHVTGELLEADIGKLIQPDDIVVFRNNHPDAPRMKATAHTRLPYVTADGCRWLVEKKVKMIVIDNDTCVRLSDGTEISRENHAILMVPGADVLAVEGAGNVSDLKTKVFYVLAFPFSAEGVDSSWVRLIAVEERKPSG